MRGEDASSNIYSEMSEISGKNKKSYLDNPKDRTKHNCLIHGTGHSSDECKVLGDFGSKNSKIRITKDHGHYPTTRKEFNIQKENNDIVNHAADEILLQENNKLSAESESNENIESDIDENDINQI